MEMNTSNEDLSSSKSPLLRLEVLGTDPSEASTSADSGRGIIALKNTSISPQHSLVVETIVEQTTIKQLVGRTIIISKYFQNGVLKDTKETKKDVIIKEKRSTSTETTSFSSSSSKFFADISSSDNFHSSTDNLFPDSKYFNASHDQNNSNFNTAKNKNNNINKNNNTSKNSNNINTSKTENKHMTKRFSCSTALGGNESHFMTSEMSSILDNDSHKSTNQNSSSSHDIYRIEDLYVISNDDINKNTNIGDNNNSNNNNKNNNTHNNNNKIEKNKNNSKIDSPCLSCSDLVESNNVTGSNGCVLKSAADSSQFEACIECHNTSSDHYNNCEISANQHSNNNENNNNNNIEENYNNNRNNGNKSNNNKIKEANKLSQQSYMKRLRRRRMSRMPIYRPKFSLNKIMLPCIIQSPITADAPGAMETTNHFTPIKLKSKPVLTAAMTSPRKRRMFPVVKSEATTSKIKRKCPGSISSASNKKNVPSCTKTPNNDENLLPVMTSSMQKSVGRKSKRTLNLMMATTAPPPQLFKNHAMLLCCTKKTVQQFNKVWRETAFDCGGRCFLHRMRDDQKTINDDKDHQDKRLSPMDVSFIESLIRKGGGVVCSSVDELSQERVGLLISDLPQRTFDYLLCLSRRIPCVSFQWVLQCCNEANVLDFNDYLLPIGYSMSDRLFLCGQSDFLKKSNVFTDLSILIDISNNEVSQSWLNLLKGCGCDVDVVLDGDGDIVNRAKTHLYKYLLTDKEVQLKQKNNNKKCNNEDNNNNNNKLWWLKPRDDEVRVVTCEWVVQCILHNKVFHVGGGGGGG